MTNMPRPCFGPVESCVDYQSYICQIDPALTEVQYRHTRGKLMQIGQADGERMGVTYVRGPWGFFVIPKYGYPTLRVSFFHDTPEKEIAIVLDTICAAFETPHIVNHQGELNE